MSSPYEGLEPRAFWRKGVVESSPREVTDLYRKKFEIGQSDRIATAGSCFAQHIARNLRQRGFNVLDVEPPPPPLKRGAERFGYSLYSARYGNIYTARQLRQLLREAFFGERFEQPVWSRNGRFFDAYRPSVEPNGLPDSEAVFLHRRQHLDRVRSLFEQTDIFVFTLGLTEAWLSADGSTNFPTASGTLADAPHGGAIAFHNFTCAEVLDDLRWCRQTLRTINPEMRTLITVSPVPLTATASGGHVLPATTYSKSVLRAAAGQIYDEFSDVDYFPSYELIASPFSRGAFFEPNLRSVTSDGVSAVMRAFFLEHGGAEMQTAETRPPRISAAPKKSKDDVVCEEALLDAFAQ